MDEQQYNNPQGMPNPYMPEAQQAQNPYEQQAQNPYAQQPQNPYEKQAQNPYSQNPYEQNPYSQDSYGQNPYGQNPYVQNSYSQNPYDQNPYGQNPYDQSPYGQQVQNPYANAQQPYQTVNVAPNNKKDEKYTPQQLKQAKLLCILSLTFYVVPQIVLSIVAIINDISPLNYTSSEYNPITNGITSILTEIASGSFFMLEIAAIVLMIVARVKYPKYTFAKVLMIVYIVEFAIAILSIVVLMIFVAYICSQCAGM